MEMSNIHAHRRGELGGISHLFGVVDNTFLTPAKVTIENRSMIAYVSKKWCCLIYNTTIDKTIAREVMLSKTPTEMVARVEIVTDTRYTHIGNALITKLLQYVAILLYW
jgi:hypothetical protein